MDSAFFTQMDCGDQAGLIALDGQDGCPPLAAATAASFPASFPAGPDRFAGLVALPLGEALACRISVSADGRPSVLLLQLGSLAQGPARMPDLMAVLRWMAPGMSWVSAECPSLELALRPLTPKLQRSFPDRILLGENCTRTDFAPFAPACDWPWRIGRALHMLAEAGGGTLQIALRHLPRDARRLRMIADAKAAAIAHAYRHPDDAAAARQLAALQAQERDIALFGIETSLHCAQPSDTIEDLVALSLFGLPAGQPREIVHGLTQLPLRLLPAQSELDSLQRQPRTAGDGNSLCLGELAEGARICLGEDDRARHLFVIGATGTGKSTLLRSLVQQDLAAGAGLVLIDPHGDLAFEVAELIPPQRRSDLIVADAANPDGECAINLLPQDDSIEAAERAADMLIEIFRRLLYRDVSEAFGPIFEQYFRNAFFLLLAAPAEERQIANLPRVFEDGAFRRKLLAECADEAVQRFWRVTAQAVTGDASLTNITPYITSKLTRLIGSTAGRRLFSSPGPGLDFDNVLREGKILILRCPKGDLGEGLASLAMSAAVMRLRDAATARANLPRAKRTVCRVYLDEVQACRGDALQMLLAEGRKFGITLTLASQSLAGIGGREDSVAAAVLANVGNLAVFRVGAPDAATLAPWLDPDAPWQTLCRQRDFSCCARLLQGGAPVTFRNLRPGFAAVPQQPPATL